MEASDEGELRPLNIHIQHNTECTLHLTVQRLPNTRHGHVASRLFVLDVDFFVIQELFQTFSLSSAPTFFVRIPVIQFAPRVNDLIIKVLGYASSKRSSAFTCSQSAAKAKAPPAKSLRIPCSGEFSRKVEHHATWMQS